MSPLEPSQDLSRRSLLVAGTALVAGSAALASSARASARPVSSNPHAIAEPASTTSGFTQPALPWKDDALAPVISAQTISFHYGKHHKAYIDNLNKLVEGKPYASMSIEEVMKASAKVEADKGVYNNAAQAWNHDFYWHSLAPNAKGPEGKLLDKIKSDLGGLDECKKSLLEAAKGQFGSGWAWLVLDGDKLKVVKTGNADNPMVTGQKPLLTIDVWEHAYYLDYQNRRPDYVQALLDKVLNWENAAKILG
jgi:Fe-Mn family superoxide dismutase